MTLSSRTTAGPMAELQVRLFGAPVIRVQGASLPALHSKKGLWLFALLVLKWERPVDRAWLAAALWPDSDHRESLKNLRNTLSDLRRALGPHESRIESPTPTTLRMDLTGVDADVPIFDALLAKGGRECLSRAVELYRGPLLEGCDEEWVVLEREQRQQACLDALEAVAQIDLDAGDPALSARRLRTCIGIDPFRETAQCGLMRALAAAGDYAGVTHAYREFRLLLHDQLHTQPAGETTALYQAIRVHARQAAAGGSAQARNVSASSNRVDGESSDEKDETNILRAYIHNLPPPLTSFIGREAEQSRVVRMLADTRLLTLTGAGGSGKTRLSLEAAGDLIAEYPGGVWLVELAPLSDPALVAQAVASVFELREQPGQSLLQSLVTTLRPKRLLLLLDNCEHLLAACAELAAALLRGCPHVRLLVTSRERLGIAGEQTYRVPSLSLPDLDAPISVESISGYESVLLFAARATLIRSDFEITPQNSHAIAHICRRLDGIPLAIELAAAWVRSMSVENLRVRLDDRFDLLTGGDKSALPRQQTLRNLIDWSYDLLSVEEKLLLQQLSVFAGGWTLEAAEAVCAVSEATGNRQSAVGEAIGILPRLPIADCLLPSEVLDMLTALVDKSLVIAEESGGTVRYRLLETVRQYAWDRLAKTGVEYAVRARHLNHYLAFAEAAAPKLLGEELALWLGILEAEHDNLRQALKFCREDDAAVEKGLRLASALERFWSTRGYLGEGREHFRALLEHPAAPKHTKARANALSGAGALAYYQGAYSAARSLHEQSLVIMRELGSKAGIAASLRSIGGSALAQADYVSANSLLHESLALHTELGDNRAIALCLLSIGAMAAQQGQLASARYYNEMSLEKYRELRNKRGISSCLFNLGAIAQEECDYRSARAMFDEVLAIRRELGDKGGISSALNNLANLAFAQEDYESAKSLYQQSMKIRVELSHRPGIAGSLRSLGNVDCEQGDFASACARYDEAVAIWRELGVKQNLSDCLLKLGSAAYRLGHYNSARYSHRERLGICRELDDTPGIADALEALAALSADDGENERAVVQWGAAAAVREKSGATQPQDKQNIYQASLREVRNALGEDAFDTAWRMGSAMTLDEAIALALATTC